MRHHFMLSRHGFDCLKIRRQVSPTKAVDGLLRIAHDDEFGMAAVQKDAREDLPLQGVGVLEFIDDAVGEAPAQGSQEMLGICAWAVERLGHVDNHVIEATQAAVSLDVMEELARILNGFDRELLSKTVAEARLIK